MIGPLSFEHAPTRAAFNDRPEGLASCPCARSGAIDEKIVACNYKFILDHQHEDFDQDAIANRLAALASRFHCQASVRASWAAVLRDGTPRSFERTEESAGLVQLLAEIPQRSRVMFHPDLG